MAQCRYCWLPTSSHNTDCVLPSQSARQPASRLPRPPVLCPAHCPLLSRPESIAAGPDATPPQDLCGSNATLVVPLHARYPHPRAEHQQQQQQQMGWMAAARSSAVTAELRRPLVLVRCQAEAGDHSPEWQLAHIEQGAQAAAVPWTIPAGNLRHGQLAAAGTAAAVGCGVAAALLALCRPQQQQAKQRRQFQRRKQQ